VLNDDSESTSVTADIDFSVSASDIQRFVQRGAESREIAKFIVNQFGNVRNEVVFTTDNLEYFVLELGDNVDFENVPYELNGLQGFGTGTDSEYVVNGQAQYAVFTITEITKGLQSMTYRATQTVDMSALTPQFIGDNN